MPPEHTSPPGFGAPGGVCRHPNRARTSCDRATATRETPPPPRPANPSEHPDEFRCSFKLRAPLRGAGTLPSTHIDDSGELVARRVNSQTRADNHWQRILGSPLATAYINELYWLARSTVDACQTIFAGAEPPPDATSSYIKVDHDLLASVYQVLNNSARIRALVAERPRRTNQQSASQYAIQAARTRWLKDSLKTVPLRETLRAEVRNSLEHFDEYLDQTALKFSKQPPTGRLLLPFDMTLGRESTLDQFTEGGSVYPLRVYLAEERTFVNCGKRVGVGAIHDECSTLAAFLLAEIPTLADQVADEGRGSSLMVLTPETFEP